MQKIAIELPKDIWEDVSDVLYGYADSIRERYDGYLGKKQAMERYGRLANRMAEVSILIRTETEKLDENEKGSKRHESK